MPCFPLASHRVAAPFLAAFPSSEGWNRSSLLHPIPNKRAALDAVCWIVIQLFKERSAFELEVNNYPLRPASQQAVCQSWGDGTRTCPRVSREAVLMGNAGTVPKHRYSRCHPPPAISPPRGMSCFDLKPLKMLNLFFYALRTFVGIG